MEEQIENGFDDFLSAMCGDGYQTDAGTSEGETSSADTEETTQETSQDVDGEPTGEDSDGGDSSEEQEENRSEESSKPEDGQEGQTFTLKVNKEDHKVSLEEMTAYAQKGVDYDRVKEQNAKLRQTNTELQEKIDGLAANQGVMDIIDMIAQKSGSTTDQIAEMLYVNFRKNAGASEDAAREELKSARLQKQLDAVNKQKNEQKAKEDDAQERAKRDLAQFQSEYPDVTLTEELVDKLKPDIQDGKSLTAAYRKYERAQEAAKIADLQRKLNASAQNEKNRKRSPGSQTDSGGSRQKDMFDEFLSAFK